MSTKKHRKDERRNASERARGWSRPVIAMTMLLSLPAFGAKTTTARPPLNLRLATSLPTASVVVTEPCGAANCMQLPVQCPPVVQHFDDAFHCGGTESGGANAASYRCTRIAEADDSCSVSSCQFSACDGP